MFTIMNDQDVANSMATQDPRTWTPTRGDNFVMFRQYHQANGWSSDDMVSQLAGLTNWNNHNVVITLANEWDIGIPGASNTVDGMTKFCTWTLECIAKLNAKGFYNIAWLTSSVGTPAIDVQPVADVIKAKIAPLWNSGAIYWTDMHLYSPNKDHIYRTDGDQIWYERRWEFLYRNCGFSPTAPGRIISSECGLDEGGVGGFPAHNMGQAEINAYNTQWFKVQSAPLIVNGVSYPSPFLAGAIFQCSPDQSWSGYNVEPVLPLVWS